MSEGTSIGRAQRPIVLPASFAQEGIWQYCRTPAGIAAYSKSEVNRIFGPLDVDLLIKTVQYIIGRHEVLRTRIADMNGEAVQIVFPDGPDNIPVLEVAEGENPADVAARSSQAMVADKNFEDLPLAQFAILRVGPEEHWLVYNCHQLIWDQWSSRILHTELTEVYEAFSKGEAPVQSPYEQIQYGDFSAWQRSRWVPGSELYNEAITWWSDHFRENAHQVRLPFLRPTLLTGVDPLQGENRWEIDPATRDAMVRLRRSAATSLYVTWLAAITAILSNRARNYAITIGTYMSSRDQDPAVSKMMGMFVNLVAMQFSCDRSLTLTEWTKQVHQIAEAAQRRGDIPHDRLRQKLAESGVQIPEVRFIFGAPMNFESDLHFAGLTLSRKGMGLHPSGGMPWGFSITVKTVQEKSVCWFNANMYDPAGVSDFLEQTKRLMVDAAGRPDAPLETLIVEPEEPADLDPDASEGRSEELVAAELVGPEPRKAG